MKIVNKPRYNSHKIGLPKCVIDWIKTYSKDYMIVHGAPRRDLLYFPQKYTVISRAVSEVMDPLCLAVIKLIASVGDEVDIRMGQVYLNGVKIPFDYFSETQKKALSWCIGVYYTHYYDREEKKGLAKREAEKLQLLENILRQEI